MFFTFNQNNSGGYFVKDHKRGVCEIIIIEADNAEKAWKKLESIGAEVDGFFDYCSCCGERWSDWLDDDGDIEPMVFDTPLSSTMASMYRKMVFVHYNNSTFKQFDLP